MPETIVIDRLFVITFITMIIAAGCSAVCVYAALIDRYKSFLHIVTALLAFYYFIICAAMLLGVLDIKTAGATYLRPADATTYLLIMLHAVFDFWLRRNKR
jgi:hypothetical protein